MRRMACGRWRIAAPAVCLLALLGGSAGALAQSTGYGQPRLAFAAAEAKGRTTFACIEGALAEARACALTRCRNTGARDCRLVAGCQPAYWSATMTVALQGSRLHLAFCSIPSRPGLIARLKDVCRTYRARGLEACTLDSVWTPRGEEELTGLRWTRRALGNPRAVSR